MICVGCALCVSQLHALTLFTLPRPTVEHGMLGQTGSRIAVVMRRVFVKPAEDMPADSGPPKVTQYTLLLKTASVTGLP